MVTATTDTEREERDIFPDSRLGDLIARIPEERTWWDADPSVAWDVEESYHGQIAALYEDAGWERCYHRESARFHFDVKLRSGAAWRETRRAIETANVGDVERLETMVEYRHDSELEWFWTDDLPSFLIELGYRDGQRWAPSVNAYQCGRSGGYANCRDLETTPRDFLALAQFLARAHSGFDSPEYARGLVETALEEYQDEKMAELASPRIERVEA